MSEPEMDIEERLRRAIEAYHEAALLFAAVKLGLAEKMGAAAWRPEDLAGALGLSPPHLARFLRGLCTIGLCEEQTRGSFALTPFGQSLTADSRLAEKVQIVVEQYWQPWANLVSTLRCGRPAFAQVFGATIFDWRRDHPEQAAMFAAYLAKATQAETEAILAALDLRATDKLVEIGAAAAVPLNEVPADADLYLLNGVLQNYADAEAAAILRQCREAMPEAARLVIVERLMPENAADDPAAIMLDLHLMTIYGGRARSKIEMESLLTDSGFSIEQFGHTYNGLTFIQCMRG